MQKLDMQRDDDFFEGLSSGKKGNKKLTNLRNQYGIDKVRQLRVKFKTPDQISEILENN